MTTNQFKGDVLAILTKNQFKGDVRLSRKFDTLNGGKNVNKAMFVKHFFLHGNIFVASLKRL